MLALKLGLGLGLGLGVRLALDGGGGGSTFVSNRNAAPSLGQERPNCPAELSQTYQVGTRHTLVGVEAGVELGVTAEGVGGWG